VSGAPAQENASGPALRGTLLALISAVSFGVTTPLVQRLGKNVGAFATAALLYAGAAGIGVLTRSRREAPLRRMHVPRVVVVAVLGGALAPAALAWGLARTSGASASLMLNLEAVFTLGLARCLYAEHVGRRVAFAASLLAAGGVLVVVDRRGGADAAVASVAGLAAVAGASFGWALDNALAKPLSAIDPAAVVAGKASVGAVLACVLALVLGERFPSGWSAAGLVVVGATGYGLSLRLYLGAQRVLGAARTASVFAAAPFVGAAVAFALGEPAGPLAVVAGAIMTAGVALHLTEKHAHRHVHAALEHEHAHRHDDGHHDHVHDVLPEGEHTHPHRHEPRVHAHAHVPDLHHAHDHDHA